MVLVNVASNSSASSPENITEIKIRNVKGWVLSTPITSGTITVPQSGNAASKFTILNKYRLEMKITNLRAFD